MAQKKLVITAHWPEKIVYELRQTYDLFAPEAGETFTSEKLMTALQDADAFAPLFYDKVNKDFIDQLPDNLSIIAGFGIGTDHIDIKAARARGIAVSNTPGVVTTDTADLTMGLIIATARRFYEREQNIRTNNWQALALMEGLGLRITGKTLGIIGLGAIGQAVAARAKAFDMRVIYHSRTRKPEVEQKLGIEYISSLEQVLQKADIVSLHAALTPDTHHMINAQTLNKMKPTAILINTGRGGLIDEKALVKALEDKTIWSAGLDVYEFEPKLAEGLAKLDNTTLLPHIGTATVETREAMAMRVKENLDNFFKTGELIDPVY
jgi:lactate dehydrogenase-like 2-hydroxyacid dehydrogenase